MNESNRNNSMNDPQEQQAIIRGGVVAAIAGGLALSFFPSGSGESFDIRMTTLVFCVVFIATFAISTILLRNIRKRDRGRK
jgi:hypothetical protein